MDDSLTVIIAPDSFKGTVSASTAAKAIAEGWLSTRPNDTLTLLPQADGGEGTIEAIEFACKAAVRHNVGPVTGPDGRPTPGWWLELPGRVAVVELAQCSGLPLMQIPDPMGATTRGLGDVIVAALKADVSSLVVALGGSASTDGGTGAFAALGLALVDDEGHKLPDGGGSLRNLSRLDDTRMLMPPSSVTVLADVTAPLLGPTGAAATFGPQKGANAAHIAMLEAGLATLAGHLGGNPAAKGCGAAGGTAYAFATLWGAHIESGSQYVQRITRLEELIPSADVVVTGEGRFDATSTTGKVVGEIISLASQHPVQIGIIAGSIEEQSGHWDCSLSHLAGSGESALAEPLRYLHMAGQDAATHFGQTASLRA